MKRLVCLLGVLLCFTCGCGASSWEGGAKTARLENPVASVSPQPTLAVSSPEALDLPSAPDVEPRTMEQGESIIIYPYVYGMSGDGSMAAVNSAVEQTIQEVTQGLGEVYVDYSLECNRAGLLSLVLHVYDMESFEEITKATLTFDWRTGKRYNIAELFASQEERWRGNLPDIVAQQAEKRGLTLLCDVLPIGNDQLYYLHADTLVLVYHTYEIATYAAGMPEFSIPLADIVGLMGEDSAMRRLIDALQTGAAMEGGSLE